MSLNMTAFQARLLRRRQLKVHLNHRKFDQAKQTDRLDQNGNGISYGARTVEFAPFTHHVSPVDSTRLQDAQNRSWERSNSQAALISGRYDEQGTTRTLL